MKGNIPEDVVVPEEYGLSRSLPRGVTLHALNIDMPKKLLNAVNRWRTEFKSRSNIAGSLGMTTVYTKLEELIPFLLRYSKML